MFDSFDEGSLCYFQGRAPYSMPCQQSRVGFGLHTHTHTQECCVFHFEGCELFQGLTISHTATFRRWNSYQRDSYDAPSCQKVSAAEQNRELNWFLPK